MMRKSASRQRENLWAKGEEQKAIPISELGLRGSAASDHDLVTEGCVLGVEFLRGTQEVGKIATGDAGGLGGGCEVRPGGSAQGGAEPLE